MKLRHANENGNVDIIETQDITLHRNTNDRNTRAISRKIYDNIDNSEYNSNFNVVYDTRNRTETFINFKTSSRTDNYESANVNAGAVVCNRQYRINTCKVIAYKTLNSEAVNLEDTGKIHTAHPSFLGKSQKKIILLGLRINNHLFVVFGITLLYPPFLFYTMRKSNFCSILSFLEYYR